MEADKTHIRRKRSCDMTYKELQRLEYLNGAQAAIYCNMSARSFYYYVADGEICKYKRGHKFYYRRTELDEKLNPRAVLDKAKYIINQEQNKFLTAKKKSRSMKLFTP